MELGGKREKRVWCEIGLGLLMRRSREKLGRDSFEGLMNDGELLMCERGDVGVEDIRERGCGDFVYGVFDGIWVLDLKYVVYCGVKEVCEWCVVD